jgi:UDP-N-acetylglucosamine 2-epimerase
MPEEQNRIASDHLTNMLFCPTRNAVENLKQEGIANQVHLVGDVMYYSILYNLHLAEKYSEILNKLGLRPGRYALATIHRTENTDDHVRLASIFHALSVISKQILPVVIPLHLRTRKALEYYRINADGILLIDLVSYLRMLLLEKYSKIILTTSGGVQKEAFWLKIPCVTLKNETEWVETVETGWNVIVGFDSALIVDAVRSAQTNRHHPQLYGEGQAAKKTIEYILANYSYDSA